MKLTKKSVNNILFLVGLIAVVVMIFTFDVSFTELWGYIRHAGYWMIPILSVWILLYGMNAYAWRAIIRANTSPDEYVSYRRIYRLTLTGFALNNTTPVGGLGGEPYRILELTKHMSKEHATSCTILYAMMHVYSHFWFWFTSIFLYMILYLLGDLPMNTFVGVSLGILFVFCLIGFYFFSIGYRNGLVKKVIKLIGKIPGLKKWSNRFLENHSDSLERIDAQIAAMRSQNKRAFYTSLIVEHSARVLTGIEVSCMLLLFGVDYGGGLQGYSLVFLHSVLMMALTSFLANLIGFLPMQIGVQEGGYAASIYVFGLPPEFGLFISIIVRVRQVIWNSIGVALMKI